MKLAILLPKKSELTETFIQAQIDHLQGDIILYHGGRHPSYINETQLAQKVGALRKVIHKIKFNFGVSPLNYQEYLFQQSLKKEKPDLILVQYGDMAARNLKVIRSLNIPMVVHFHGYDASVYAVLSSLEKEYRAMFHYAKAIIGVSKKMVAMLKEYGAPADKVHHVCYGPNIKFAEISSNFSSKTFVAVGRFVDKKAPHLTIMAFQKVLHKHPDAQLKMIGNGPLFSICEDIVRHFHLEKNIQLLGAHGLDRILSEMENCCAFVQHSRRAENGDMEGTPVAILEAQLAGIPVISTIHAGIPDVVIQGETGFLSAENDVDSMAEAMTTLLDNLNLAQQMGQQGRERILQNFMLESYIASIQKLLQ